VSYVGMSTCVNTYVYKESSSACCLLFFFSLSCNLLISYHVSSVNKLSSPSPLSSLSPQSSPSSLSSPSPSVTLIEHPVSLSGTRPVNVCSSLSGAHPVDVCSSCLVLVTLTFTCSRSHCRSCSCSHSHFRSCSCFRYRTHSSTLGTACPPPTLTLGCILSTYPIRDEFKPNGQGFWTRQIHPGAATDPTASPACRRCHG